MLILEPVMKFQCQKINKVIENMNNKKLYQSKISIIFYVWVVLSLVIIITFLLKSGIRLNSLIFSGLIDVITYYLLCRNLCRIFIYNDKFKVCYAFFGNQSIEIRFEEIVELDYKKGFFDFTAPFDNTYHFKLICYDTLFLKLKARDIQININSRFGAFNILKDKVLEEIR